MTTIENIVTLEDVTSRIGDGLHGTPNYDENGDYYFINGNNLSNGKIVIKSDTKRISREEYNKIKKIYPVEQYYSQLMAQLEILHSITVKKSHLGRAHVISTSKKILKSNTYDIY